MTTRGRVVKKPFGEGTKSEHQAVMLVTDQGELKLRREGGNPFSDPELDRLVGKTITCEGEIHGATFIMRTWTVERGG
ncbi:hypothetical protein [Candidatus Nitrospira bockiana]